MLARLKSASRRCIVLFWAMAAVFAVAPALSTALASPPGVFSRVFILPTRVTAKAMFMLPAMAIIITMTMVQSIIMMTRRVIVVQLIRASIACACTMTAVVQASSCRS